MAINSPPWIPNLVASAGVGAGAALWGTDRNAGWKTVLLSALLLGFSASVMPTVGEGRSILTSLVGALAGMGVVFGVQQMLHNRHGDSA